MVMVVDGYKFSLHYSRNCKERWQCSRRSYFGCKAVLHKVDGTVTYTNNLHNHDPAYRKNVPNTDQENNQMNVEEFINK